MLQRLKGAIFHKQKKLEKLKKMSRLVAICQKARQSEKKMAKRYGNLFTTVASISNLYEAFTCAAKTRELQPDVLKFSANPDVNLAKLHYELTAQTYERGKINQFKVYDPNV